MDHNRGMFHTFLPILVTVALFSTVCATRLLSMRTSLCKSLVICGPSGVGKGTLINKLLTDHPSKFGLSVSHTTRKPRLGEEHGVHYHFVEKEFMLKDIKSGRYKYIEHAEVHNNLYGTREDDVSAIHEAGKICILDVDSKGVKQIKSCSFPAKYVFITPSSMAALEFRLRARGTEEESQIQVRLNNAKAEIEYGTADGNFDAVLVNETLEETYSTLVQHIQKWFAIF